MKTQKVKRIIDAGGKLPGENDPGGFILDLLSKQLDMLGFDINTAVQTKSFCG